MTTYDSTNSGVIFDPHQDQRFSGQGKLNVEGSEKKVILIYERLKKDGDPVLVMYERAGVLFTNDKKGNEKAPDFSGPLDNHPNHRVAAWKGEKDGRRYMSLKASPKQSSGGNGGGDGWETDNKIPFVAGDWETDDEIPF